jgi:hypothetical protein
MAPAASTLLLKWSRSMTSVRKLVSKKELKSIYGIPYSFAHVARLEAARDLPSGYVSAGVGSPGTPTKWRSGSLHDRASSCAQPDGSF